MHSYLTEPLAGGADDRDAYVFYDRHGRVSDRVSYGALDALTSSLGASLKRDHGIGFADRVALAFGPGIDFVRAFFACIKIGAIPVPLPSAAGALAGRGDTRMRAVIEDCSATAVLADAKRCGELRGADWLSGSGDLSRLIAFETLDPHAELDAITRNETLFLQYTSGSTSSPRGVIVSHANVIHNATFGTTVDRPSMLSWLPHYHDMGLIGYLLAPIIRGGTAHNFSPMDFVRRPALWLELMTATGATHSSAPNFAFETCLREDKIPASAVAGYRLERVEALMNGAEPVRPATMERFLEKFAPAGLRREALIAAYGLAENTLCVSTCGLRRISISRDALDQRREIADAVDGEASVRLQSCGAPIPGVDLRIVDPVTMAELPEGRFGEVWVGGPSKAGGYWNKPELSDARFRASIAGQDGTWLRTGDIGALRDGELFLQGRIGEMVVSGGANFFPEDVERALSEALRRHGLDGLAVAAFANRSESGSESFVAVIESRARQPIPLLAPLHAIMKEMTDAPVSTLAVVGHGVIARTTSGKISRYRIREAWQGGRIVPIERFEVPAADERTQEGDVLGDIAARLHALGPGARIADLGLSSIELVELSVAMEELWQSLGRGAGAMPEEFFDLGAIGAIGMPDIEAMLAHASNPDSLRGHLTDLLARLTRELREEDARRMAADVSLADGFSPAADAPSTQGGARLVTGASGFLGSFLVASLLDQTDQPIVALARPQGGRSAHERVLAALEETGVFGRVPRDSATARLTVIESDLGAPRLGLSPDDWQNLSLEVSDIYHCGAAVDYVKDYQALRAANVLGTAAIVELATAGVRKTLHHVSSTMIYGWSRLDVAAEEDCNPDMRELDFGYAQSKWVSEQIVWRAFARGLSGHVYRPAFVTASRNGAYVRGDIVARMLGYMIRHRVSTSTANQLSLLPADIAAHNIVALSLEKTRTDSAYNIVADRYVCFTDLVAAIGCRYGYAFDMLPLDRFVAHANRHCEHDDDFYPLRSFINYHYQQVARMADKRYDSRQYRAARDVTTGTLPDATLAETVEGIVEFLLAQGLIPPPRAAAARA